MKLKYTLPKYVRIIYYPHLNAISIPCTQKRAQVLLITAEVIKLLWSQPDKFLSHFCRFLAVILPLSSRCSPTSIQSERKEIKIIKCHLENKISYTAAELTWIISGISSVPSLHTFLKYISLSDLNDFDLFNTVTLNLFYTNLLKYVEINYTSKQLNPSSTLFSRLPIYIVC